MPGLLSVVLLMWNIQMDHMAMYRNFKGSLKEILLILEVSDLWNTPTFAITHQSVHHTQLVLLVGTTPILSYKRNTDLVLWYLQLLIMSTLMVGRTVLQYTPHGMHTKLTHKHDYNKRNSVQRTGQNPFIFTWGNITWSTTTIIYELYMYTKLNNYAIWWWRTIHIICDYQIIHEVTGKNIIITQPISGIKKTSLFFISAVLKFGFSY